MGVNRISTTSKTFVTFNAYVDMDDTLVHHTFTTAAQPVVQLNEVQPPRTDASLDGTYDAVITVSEDTITSLDSPGHILHSKCSEDECTGCIIDSACNVCGESPTQDINGLEPLDVCLLINGTKYKAVLRSYDIASTLWGRVPNSGIDYHDLRKVLLSTNGVDRVTSRMLLPVRGVFTITGGDITSFNSNTY